MLLLQVVPYSPLGAQGRGSVTVRVSAVGLHTRICRLAAVSEPPCPLASGEQGDQGDQGKASRAAAGDGLLLLQQLDKEVCDMAGRDPRTT